MASASEKSKLAHKDGVMKSLFCGVFDSNLVFPYPSMQREEKEAVQMMLDAIHQFYRRYVDSAKIDKDACIPTEVLQKMKELGLFGLSIPTEYGGLGLSTTAYDRVMEEIGALDASLAVTLAAHHSIGLKGLLLFGTQAQKQKYLPRLASGEMIAAFALTEPSAGSDAGGLQMRADLSSDGKHYILSGNKIWISNGGIADLFTVFAKTSLQGAPSTKSDITAFLVERSYGVRSGPSEHKLGIRGSETNTLYFEDVLVPVENVLGELGQGFKGAMTVLNSGRLGLASIALGGCKSMLKLSISHVNERKAFGRLIGDFDQIKDKIARMMAETYALESMTYLTTAIVDEQMLDYEIESAICKIVGSETLWKVANEALQIAAGAGYMQEYPFERRLRDSRIAMIFEGTNEILRSFIALSGVKKRGKQLSQIGAALRSPFSERTQLAAWIRQMWRMRMRKEYFPKLPASLKQAHCVLAKYARIFSGLVDKALRKHGSKIVEDQFVQLRLSEMAIDLFGIIATLSRTYQIVLDRGEKESQNEIDLCQSFAHLAQKRLQRLHLDFDTNVDELQRHIATWAYQAGKYAI